MIRSRAAALSPAFLALSFAACGGSVSSPTTTGTTGAGTGGAGGEIETSSSTTAGTGGVAGTGGASGTGGVGGVDAGPPVRVTFRYTPAWEGVTAVEVVGGFGLSTDWQPKAPLVQLTVGASGTWTGTAMLAAGTYPYLFQVTGDADGPAGLVRYSVDGGLTAYVACPTGSPSYSKIDMNPCSLLTVPQAAPDVVQPVTGKVTYGGKAAAGYLAIIERDETGSHHYFANRTDTAADGSFSLSVAPGKYRIQMLYPDLLTTSDKERSPLTLAALRRAFSAASAVSAPVALPPVEMEYLDYASLAPTGTATLPTTFHYTVLAGATGARPAVYGTASGTGTSIGDPWWEPAYGTATSAGFDGTFNTAQATETMVKTGESYFWGTWQELGPIWTGESMVFTITWN